MKWNEIKNLMLINIINAFRAESMVDSYRWKMAKSVYFDRSLVAVIHKKAVFVKRDVHNFNAITDTFTYNLCIIFASCSPYRFNSQLKVDLKNKYVLVTILSNLQPLKNIARLTKS